MLDARIFLRATLPLLLALSIVAPLCALACDDEPKIDSPDRSWIKSDAPIYGVTRKGQIFRTHFNSNKIEMITNHHFNTDVDDVHVSPDKRYILYSGRLGEGSEAQYLYDVKEDKEITMPQPKLGYYYPTFSPVNDLILLVDGYRAHNQLALYDPGTGQLKSIPYPEPLTEDAPKWYFGDWSQDGRNIYVITGIDHSRFYKYDVAAATYTKFNGHQTHNGGEIIEDGKSIRVYNYDGCSIQPNCDDSDLKSPSGKLHVRLMDDHSLVIEESDKNPVLVQGGSYSQCFGESVRITAWLGDDYLIYASHGIPYIYGFREQKKSVLFDPREVDYFFW